jgi:hypothetical protein
MSLFSMFKIPPMPKEPQSMKSYRAVDRETFLDALKPLDVGLTRGHGPLGFLENFYRVKEREGDTLVTHAFLVYGDEADPEIVESNWPRVRRGLLASAYLGSNRHTVFARYTPLETWQRMGALSALDTMIQARTPYAGGQIAGFLQKVLGMKVGNKSGVTCSECATVVLRGQQIPFCGVQQSFMVTPTSALTWEESPQAQELGWKIIAEAVGEKFYLPA